MNDKTFTEAIWSTNPSDLSDPSTCAQGHASFTAGHGVNLEIPLGTLLDHEPINGVVTYGVDPLTADCVYGLSQTGAYLTITKVFETRRSMTCPGFDCQALHGHELMVSKKPMGSSPLVTTFTFDMAGLREWVGISPTRHSVRYDDRNHLDEMTFRYAAADVPDVVLFDKNGVKISVDCMFTDKGGHIPQFEFGFVTDYRLTVSFDEPLPLGEVLDSWVFPVQKFLSFCMGFFGGISSMRFCTAEEVWADYYVALVEGDEPSKSDLTNMPLCWHSCSDRIPCMLDTWLGFEGFAKEAAIRVVSALADWRLPLELRFLAVAQAFEAVTRVDADLYELPAEEFERRKSLVVSPVEETEVRQWVKQILHYANNKSAGKLAKEQMERLGEFADYVVPDRKRFLTDHRQTRNYNTHLDAESKPHVLHGEDLLVHSDATYLLLYASVCLLMGLEPAELLKLLKKTGWKSTAFYKSRRLYAVGK